MAQAVTVAIGHQVQMAITYLDQNGAAAVTGTPAESTTPVTADSPSGLMVAVQ